MDGVQPGDDLVAAFRRWAAGERASAAAGNRARERRLRDQAAASATWAGVLVDLAEAAATVVVRLGALTCTGRIVAVARDFCVIEPTSGRPSLIALAAISALSPQQTGQSPPAGDRQPHLSLSMAGALAALAEERTPVGLTLAHDVHVEGELAAVGEDVVTLRNEAPARRPVYVRLASIVRCELR
ncbi:MAG TPA: hypothetical protein VLX59_08035 [Acidimicrobiales bacterium]|nr:hypothetical protein [Acidimicrobiales bacterium]